MRGCNLAVLNASYEPDEDINFQCKVCVKEGMAEHYGLHHGLFVIYKKKHHKL
jgi:hypothetical protein